MGVSVIAGELVDRFVRNKSLGPKYLDGLIIAGDDDFSTAGGAAGED